MVKTIVFIPQENQKSHLERCLATAKIINKRLKTKVFFLTTKDVTGFQRVIPNKHLLKQIVNLKADLVVFDQHKTDEKLILKLRKTGDFSTISDFLDII